MLTTEPISVIIPCRPDDVPFETIETLFQQTYRHLVLITVIDWHSMGQSWARNEGLRLAKTRYVLFSDFDIRWDTYAIELLYSTLRGVQNDAALSEPTADIFGYAYGGYHQTRNDHPEITFGLEAWSWERLRSGNYISTMSLIDTLVLKNRRCLYFDESLRRLEDWDLWLRCGQANIRGIGVGKILFTTRIKPGISHDGPLSHQEAELMVRQRRFA